jgi:capsular exopolysaccharide synthesis family protein
MSPQLPVPSERGINPHEAVARAIARHGPAEQEVHPREVWAAVWRSRWWFAACTVLTVGLAAFLTSRATPVYEATATLKVEEQETNLPGMFKDLTSLSQGSELGTEAEVLESRTLAESTAISLSMQVRAVEPRGVARDKLFDSISVSSEAESALYDLTRLADGKYALLDDSTKSQLTTIRPGERLSLKGLSFRFVPGAAQYEDISFRVLPLDAAVGIILGNLSVSQPGRDVNILTIDYEDKDPGLVWQVPNTIVARYLDRRRDVAQAQARSTVAFLKNQLDTVSAQLGSAEEALKAYRERTRAIDPQTEASSQLQRLVSLQSEKASIESERTALSRLLAEVDAKAARQQSDDSAVYQELVAFPTLMRSGIATGVLASLTTVDQQRAELLSRRTPTDPDVVALTQRSKDLQGQLRSVVVTYLQGLGNQVATLNSELDQFGRLIEAMPARELEVARLERQPKVLEDVSTLLQTRLKEAEIAQSAGDPSVQVLDPATPPDDPIKPRPKVNLLAGLICGLLLGGVLTFVREYRDRTVHTRAEIERATGLPVLGLIPTTRGPRWTMRRVGFLPERTKDTRPRAVAPPRPPQPRDETGSGRPPGPRTVYTFWSEATPDEPTPTDVLAELPTNGQGSGEASRHLEPSLREGGALKLALTPVGHAVAEAYGILQTNIAFALPDRDVRTVVVTSALPGEGKTTSAVNLSLSFARRGMRVLLIDADLRRATVHTVFEMKRDPGLSEVLQGSVPFERAFRSVDIDGETMHFLPAGAPAASPTGLLDSDLLRTLLAGLREKYDFVVIDSPPANIVTDAAVLGAMVDGVIVVARVGKTEAAAVGWAIDHLRHVRATVLGVVLNDIDFKRDAAYDPTYRYQDYEQYTSPVTP